MPAMRWVRWRCGGVVFRLSLFAAGPVGALGGVVGELLVGSPPSACPTGGSPGACPTGSCPPDTRSP